MKEYDKKYIFIAWLIIGLSTYGLIDILIKLGGAL